MALWAVVRIHQLDVAWIVAISLVVEIVVIEVGYRTALRPFGGRVQRHGVPVEGERFVRSVEEQAAVAPVRFGSKAVSHV